MRAYRDGYALSGARGLVRRLMDRATDPRVNPEIASGFYEFSLRAHFRLPRDGADLGPEGRIPAYDRNPQAARRDERQLWRVHGRDTAVGPAPGRHTGE